MKNSSDDWITKLLKIWYGQSSDEYGDKILDSFLYPISKFLIILLFTIFVIT